jgi:hypothetical protein
MVREDKGLNRLDTDAKVGAKMARADDKKLPRFTSKALTEVQENANPFRDDLDRSGHFLKRPLSNTFCENCWS